MACQMLKRSMDLAIVLCKGEMQRRSRPMEGSVLVTKEAGQSANANKPDLTTQPHSYNSPLAAHDCGELPNAI